MITNSTTGRAAATTPSIPMASGHRATPHHICYKRIGGAARRGAEVAQ